MKQIALGGKKYPGLFALIDDDDFDLLHKFKWHPQPGRQTFYAKKSIYKNGICIGSIKMHQVLFPQYKHCDHINGNGLDNRKENLRESNHQTNAFNRAKQTNSTSGFKGVSYLKKNKCWSAKSRLSGKDIWLGSFKTKEAAALAYNDFAIKNHGEYARLNEI